MPHVDSFLCMLLKLTDIKKEKVKLSLHVWAQTDSNRRPSACKADALNQLSYAPFLLKSVAKVESFFRSTKCFTQKIVLR